MVIAGIVLVVLAILGFRHAKVVSAEAPPDEVGKKEYQTQNA